MELPLELFDPTNDVNGDQEVGAAAPWEDFPWRSPYTVAVHHGPKQHALIGTQTAHPGTPSVPHCGAASSWGPPSSQRAGRGEHGAVRQPDRHPRTALKGSSEQ